MPAPVARRRIARVGADRARIGLRLVERERERLHSSLRKPVGIKGSLSFACVFNDLTGLPRWSQPPFAVTVGHPGPSTARTGGTT